MKSYEGMLTAEGLKVGIVASRFNHAIVDRLLEGAIDCFSRHGGQKEDLTIVRVPGAWEIPMGVKELLLKEDIEGVVALGVLIRGATPHFDYIANELSKGLAMLSLEHRKPVSFGVITADTLEQAIERAGTKHGNRGWDAMLAVIEMINLFRALR